MKSTTEFIKKNPTPFNIGGILLILYGIVMFLYSLTLSGGESLISVAFLFVMGVGAIIAGIDYAIMKYLKYKQVLILETVVTIIIFVWWLCYYFIMK